jgi:hypothetical protein
MVDWKQKCKLEVQREHAGQHGHCATCPNFVLAGPMRFPNKCKWKGWKE